MANAIERFYDRRYKKGRKVYKPNGILGKLYLSLRKYEIHRVDAVIDLLSKGSKILDLGIGGGYLIAKCKNKKLFRNYYGLDIGPNVIKTAKNNIKEFSDNLAGVSLKKWDLNNKLPYKANMFDAVTCIAVLEHIFDPYFAVSEIKRVLKKGGELVIEVPNLVWLPRRISVFMGKLPVTAEEEGWDGGHLHYFTFSETIKLLQSAGFDIRYKGSSGIFSNIRNIRPELLGGNIILKAVKK